MLLHNQDASCEGTQLAVQRGQDAQKSRMPNPFLNSQQKEDKQQENGHTLEILSPPPQAQSAELTPHPPSAPLPPAGWKAPGEKAYFAGGREGDGNGEVLVPTLNLPLRPSCSCTASLGAARTAGAETILCVSCTGSSCSSAPHHRGASSAQNCQEKATSSWALGWSTSKSAWRAQGLPRTQTAYSRFPHRSPR